MLVKPWDERKRTIFPIQEEVAGKLAAVAGDPRAGVPSRRRCRAPGSSRSSSSIASTASHEELVRFAEQIVQEAIKSGQFAFPPITDVRIDQAKAEIVHRSRQGRLDGAQHAEVGADLSSMLGGNFVNRFNIDGRSYKVIAQIERAGRLTPDQLEEIHITGPNGQLDAAQRGRDAPRRRRAAHAQPLPAAQRGEDLGRRAALARRRPARARGRGREDPAARLPRRLHGRVAPAAAGVGEVPAGDGPRPRAHLPGARGAVQLVPRSASSSSPARCRSRCSARSSSRSCFNIGDVSLGTDMDIDLWSKSF